LDLEGEQEEFSFAELEAFLKPMVAARRCAQEILMEQGSTCLADLQRQLKASSGLLLSMDRSFRCELEWLCNAADEHLATAIHKAIEDCLPTSTVRITLSQACSRLDALLESDKAKFASLRSQSEIRAVRRVLDKMVAGVSPDSSVKAGGDIFEKVWNRLQYFVVVQIPGAEAWGLNNPGVSADTSANRNIVNISVAFSCSLVVASVFRP